MSLTAVLQRPGGAETMSQVEPQTDEPAPAARDDLFFEDVVRSYVENARFVARRWLATRLEEKLAAPACRFVLLTGPPGVGKSAFVASLAQGHPDWCRYFIRRDQYRPLAEPSAESFVLTSGLQLAARRPELFDTDQVELAVNQRVDRAGAGSEVVGAEIERLLASPFRRVVVRVQQEVGRGGATVAGLRIGELIADPRLLPLSDLQFMALIDPARALLGAEPDARLVLLLDGLDELRHRSLGANLLEWLATCPALPANVRLVVTCRTDDALLAHLRTAQAGALEELPLEPDDESLQVDVGAFARALAREPEIAPALATGPGEEAFVAEAMAHAHGNLGFIDAVARAVDQGVATGDRALVERALDMTELPETLEEVNAAFLQHVRSRVESLSVEVEDPDTGQVHYLDAWSAEYARILGVLSVAREPLTLAQIRALGGIRSDGTAAMRSLGQFLEKAGDRHRLYHATLAQFLTDPAARDHDLYLDPRESHARIVRHYRRGARAWSEVDWRQVDDYGVTNLAAHLADAALTDQLVDLIDRDWMQLRFTRSGHAYGGFAADVRTALNAVLQSPAPRLDWVARLQAASMVVQDAALVHDDEDLRLLSRLGRCDEAIANVMLRPAPTDKVSGLLAILRSLGPDSGRSSSILESARQVALACRDPHVRSDCLERLIAVAADEPVLDIEPLVEAAEHALQEIKGERDRAVGARDLVRALAAGGRTADARRVASGITDPIQQGWARLSLVSALVGAGDYAAATRLVPEPAATGWRSDEGIHARMRAEAVAVLAAGLARAGEDEHARGRFEDAERVARNIDDDFDREDALFHVSDELASSGALVEALRVAESISGPYRERALHSVVAGHVATEDLDAATRLTLTMSRTVQDGAWRGFAERDVAVGLVAAGELDEALRRAEDADPARRVTSLCRFAEALHARGDATTARELLARAERLTSQVDPQKRVDAVRTVVRFWLVTGGLADATRCYAEAQRLAAERRDVPAHAAAVSHMAACLAHCGHPSADAFFEDAHGLVASLPEFDRHAAERTLAQHALRSARFDLAWQVAAAAPRDLQRVPLWCELGRTLAPLDGTRARSAFARASALTRLMNAEARSADLRHVARSQAQIGWFDEAEATVSELDREIERCFALVDLATALFPHDAERAQGLLRDAEAAALQGFGEQQQCEGLAAVIDGWLAAGNVHEPSRIVPTLEDDLRRVQSLARLAGALADCGDELGRTLLDEGLTLATACHEGDAESVENTKSVAFERMLARQSEVAPPPRALDASLWCGWFWEEPEYRARALCWLASALSECRDPRATRALEMAREAARAIPYENSRDTTLLKVEESMIEAGDVGGAARVAGDIRQASERSRADQRLVTAWTAAGKLEEAHHVAESATTEHQARQLLREVAVAHARAGDAALALSIVREKNLDDYLAALAAVLMEGSAGSAERVREALAAAAGVAAWNRPDWGDIWRRMVLRR